MVKKILKFSYWTFFIIVLALAGIKYFTPAPKATISTKDIPVVKTYHTKSKTYTNSKIGTYQYLGHTTDKGTFYLRQKNANQKVLVLRFKFTNTGSQIAKPYTDLQPLLKVKQGKKTLKTGNLHLSNKASSLATQTNNAVKIYQAGEHAKIALPYAYQTQGKTIKVYLDGHLLTKFR